MAWFLCALVGHRWGESQRVFAPPRASFKARDCPVDVFERAAHGVTTIIENCDICDKQRVTEILGDARKATS